MASVFPKGLDLIKTQQSLDYVLDMVQSCLPWCNAHSNDFITHSHWEVHIPSGLQEELLCMSEQQLCQLPARYTNLIQENRSCKMECKQDRQHLTHKTPMSVFDIQKDISSYLQAACNTNLQSLGVLVKIEDLFQNTGPFDDNLQIQNFMTNKKSHEVDLMTILCSRLAKMTGTEVVVDVGSGKGYLSTQLALKCHMTVVGIDAQMINTKGAIKRAKVLNKQWKGLVRNAKELQETGTVTKKSKKQKKKLKKERMLALMEEKNNHAVSSRSEFVINNEKVKEEENVDEDLFDGLGNVFDIEEGNNLMQSSKSKSDLTDHCDTHNLTQTSSSVASNDTSGAMTNPGIDVSSHITSLACEKLETNNHSSQGARLDKDNNLIFRSDEGSTRSDIKSFHTLTLNEEAEQVGSSKEISDSINPEILKSNEGLHSAASSNTEVIQNASNKSLTEGKWRLQSGEDLPYIPVTMFVDTSVNLVEIVSEVLGGHSSPDLQKGGSLMLTGLHTCGALGSSILELFVNNPSVKVLCYVGCCYHYMTEEFVPNPVDQPEDGLPRGFPMSSYLKQKKVYIGKRARNLASQSVYRLAQDTELSFATYPRTLVQKILLDVVGYIDPDWKGLRGLGSTTPDMYQYVIKVFSRLGLSHEKITQELVDDYCHRFKEEKKKLAAFRQLKSVLAPSIESLILLDRVCYLLEQECIGTVNLVQLFDPVISPRCYGIVAVKNDNTTSEIDPCK